MAEDELNTSDEEILEEGGRPSRPCGKCNRPNCGHQELWKSKKIPKVCVSTKTAQTLAT